MGDIGNLTAIENCPEFGEASAGCLNRLLSLRVAVSVGRSMLVLAHSGKAKRWKLVRDD